MLLRDTIFLVDASSSSRAALRKTFESRFNILEAGTLSQAEVLFRDNQPYIAAMLLDMKLLGQKDAATIRWLTDIPETQLFPCIAVVDTDDVQNEYRAFQMGATDVIFRPLHSVAAERRVCNLIELFRSRWKLEDLVEEQATALRQTNEALVDALSSIIEGRSVESGQHVLRIRRFTRILLEEVARSCPEYELNEDAIQSISSAAALHDVGKITIPDAILQKSGALTPEEYEIMKTHTTAGSDILARMDMLGSEEYLRYAYNICRYHHERWDGKGYPEGLAGNAIPICAQVVGLADCYDALMTDRVYKAAYPGPEAASMILNGDCGVFSPVLLECFKAVRHEMERLAAAYADGLSPRNDAIRAPLSPPARTAADSLQTLVDKYNALLHFLDATVIDLDLDQHIYHVTYNSDPDFDFITKTVDRQVTFRRWVQRMFSDDGQEASPEQLARLLDDFTSSGQRRASFPTLIRGSDGQMHPCTATLLRSDPEDPRRKFTLICKKEHPPGLWDGPEPDVGFDRAMAGMLTLFQPCIYDRWLTLSGRCSVLCDLLGYTEEEISQQFHGRLMEIVPSEGREAIRGQLHEQLRHGPLCEVEFHLRRKDGKMVWIIGKGILSADAKGVERLYLVFVDITESRKVQDKLRRTLDQQELIIAQTSDIVFELDFRADHLTCSPKWEERFGYKPISDHFSERILTGSHFHPDDIALFQEKINMLKSGVPFVEFPLRVADSTGHYRWSRIRAAAQTDDMQIPTKAVGVFIDIDKEQRSSQNLIARAGRDSLTKLLNKETCRHEVEACLAGRKEQTISVLAIIDLDNFKEVNDRYGHLYGDAVLARIADETGKMFRGTDIVGRIGGDEFLVFLPQVSEREPAAKRFDVLVERLRSALSEYSDQADLSCSVGIAFAPDHGTAYEELFQRADQALYMAKHLGKNRCCLYSPAATPALSSSMVSKRIDSDGAPDLPGGGLIQYVFDRLYESGDTEGTIRSLLEIVGSLMDVSRVYIFENDEENLTCSNTFEWCNEGIEPQIHVLQNISYEEDIAGFRESFNERGIFYSPDVTQLPRHIRDIVEPQGIRSLLACAIRDNGKFRGYVGFDDNTKLRLWTQEQVDMLMFLSQMLSLFLLKHRMQERSDTLVSDLCALLDRQADCIYVIDAETSQLRFLNGKLSGMEPDAKVGMPCYQALRGQSTPCAECPLHTDEHCRVVRNEHYDLPFRVTASPLHWAGKPAWLITCQEMQP